MSDGKIVYRVSVDTSDAEQGLKDLENKAGDIGASETQNGWQKACDYLKENWKGLASVYAKTLGAVAVTAAAALAALGKEVVNQVKEVAAYGDVIDKNSQKVGLSAEAYQEWDYAMQLAGTDMQSVSMGLNTLTNKLDDAKNGSETAIASFEAIGLSLEDLQDISREELLGRVIKGLQNVEDETKKAALANDLLSRSGKELMPMLNMTNEELDAVRKEFRDYGMAMSDEGVKSSAAFQDSLTKLSGTMNGLKTNMIGNLLPGMTQVVNGFSDLIAGNDGATEALNQGLQSVIDNFVGLIPQFTDLLMTLVMAVLESAPEIVRALASGIMSTLPELVQCITDVVVELILTITAMLPDLVDLGITCLLSLIQGLADAIPQLIAMLPTIINTIIMVLVNNLGTIIKMGIQILVSLIYGLVEAIPQLIDMLPTIITTIVSVLLENLPLIINAAIQIMLALITGLIQSIPDLLLALPEIFKAIIEAFRNVNWGDVGTNLMDGIKNGVLNAVQGLWNAAINAVKKVWQGVKDFLGISSPSKLFEKTIGVQMIAGQIEGIEDETPDLVKATVDSQEQAYRAAIDYTVPTSDQLTREMSANMSMAQTMTVERTINVPLFLDGREIARATAWDMGEQLAWEAR
jgi:hypothetical protein